MHIRPSNTWYPAGSAHHYWCQSSAPRFARNGQPDPLTWSWCLVGRARLICVIDQFAFILTSLQVCETRRREDAARCTQLACALHTSSRVELKVAVTPEKFIGASRLTPPLVTTKTRYRRLFRSSPTMGREKRHNFMNGEIVLPYCGRQPNLSTKTIIQLHPTTPPALPRSFTNSFGCEITSRQEALPRRFRPWAQAPAAWKLAS